MRRVSILAIDKVFASTLMQAKDFFHLASLRYGKQLGLGLQLMFEIHLVSPDGLPVESFSNVQLPVDGGLRFKYPTWRPGDHTGVNIRDFVKGVRITRYGEPQEPLLPE